MKKNKLMWIIAGLVVVSTCLTAAKRPTKAAPKKNIPVLEYDKLEKEIALTEEQKMTFALLLAGKEDALNEKLANAKTDKEKKDIRKASNDEFGEKLKENFGKELGGKISFWYNLIPDSKKTELKNKMMDQ